MLRIIDFHRVLLVSYPFSVDWREADGGNAFLIDGLSGELPARDVER